MSLNERKHKKEIGARDMDPVVERFSQAALLMESTIQSKSIPLVVKRRSR